MTARRNPWWQSVSDEAEDPAAARDPWADKPLRAPGLTDEQHAVLAGLDDQPPVPTVDGHETGDDQPSVPRLRPGNGTGNPPGDTKGRRPYGRQSWKESDR